MKATKGEITRLSTYLWKEKYGSRKKLAELIGCKQSELTRLLRGGTISEEKFNKIFEIIDRPNGNGR